TAVGREPERPGAVAVRIAPARVGLGLVADTAPAPAKERSSTERRRSRAAWPLRGWRWRSPHASTCRVLRQAHDHRTGREAPAPDAVHCRPPTLPAPPPTFRSSHASMTHALKQFAL